MTETAGPEQPLPSPRPGTPYVGLVPYREEDFGLFFGRDDERRIVTANLRASRLTILYGPSGVGKTSLLQAGVVHDLRNEVVHDRRSGGEDVPIAICSFRDWREQPLPALMDAMHDAVREVAGGDRGKGWRPGASVVENRVQLSIAEPAREIAEVLEEFRRDGVAVRDMTLKTATLEAVFLQLTGKELRE